MSSNITPSFDEAFKHIKNRLPSNTLQTLEQNYNKSLSIPQEEYGNYIQDEARKQKELKVNTNKNNWDKIFKERDIKEKQNLEDYKAKTKDFIEFKNAIETYKAQGLDVSSYEDILKNAEKQLETSYGEKFKLMVKAQPRAYKNTLNKAISYLDDKEYKPQYSNDELLEIEKVNREKAINPIKTMAMDVLLDPANAIPLGWVMKGGRLVRATKDFAKGGVYTATTDALKHGSDENYEFKDSLYAGAFGGVLNAGLGQLFGKSLKNANALSDIEQAQAKVKNDVSLNEYKGDIGDGAIASKLSDDIDKLSPNQANINKTEDLSNPNTLNSLSKADKQEKRGIYNVTFNGKNSSEVKKYDLEALNDYIKYEKGFDNTRTGKGAVHIQKHLEDGSFGEISKEELLDLGNVIRNGQLSLEHGKNIYRLKKDDGTILTAVTGSKGNEEKVITFYSNRNKGKGVHTSGTITSTFPNNENITNSTLKIAKSPRDMTTEELVEAYKQNQQRALNGQNPNINKLQDINTQDFLAKTNIAKEELINPKLSKNHIDEFINKTIGNENISSEQRDLIHTLKQTGLVDKLNTQKLKSNIAGNYDISNKTISLNENPNINSQTKAQALVHELIHSSSENLLRASAKFKAEVSLIYHEAKKSFQAKGLDTNVYGFTKPSEFIAEAFSNPNFAKELNSVKVSPIVKEKLGLGEYINTLWEAIYNKFSQVVSKLSGKEFKLNKDSYYYALQNSINKHRNDVEAIKDSIVGNKGLRDEVLSPLNSGKVLDKENSRILNSIVSSDKPLDEKIAHLQNATKEIFKTIKKPTAEQKEMYNLVMGFKKIVGMRRKDSLDVITTLIQKGYQRTDTGSGLDHIVFRHYGAGAVGELSPREILNIGKTIQQGTLTKEIAKDIKDKFSTYNNIRVYKRNVNPKDDINLYVVVGEDRNKIHNVITYYSNRGVGDNLSKSTTGILNKSDLSSTVPSRAITNENISNQTLKTAKEPKNMSTKELVDTYKANKQKEKDILNSQIEQLNDKVAVQKVGNVFDRIINNVFDKSIEALSKVKIGSKTLGEWGNAIKESSITNAFTGHKLFEKKSYMNPREDMLKQKNKLMEDILLLHEKLKFLSKDTRKAMYEYMNGNKNIILDPNVKSFSDKYIKYIDNISSELVDLKVIDQAQADKFYGRYLFRSYSKDLKKQFATFNNSNKTIDSVHSRGEEWIGKKDEYEHYLKTNQLGDFFDGMIDFQKLKNGKYKFRRDWSKAQRQSWGEIDDIAYILPNTLMRMQEMKSHAIFLKQISKSCDLVLDTKGLSDIPQGYTLLNGKKYGALNGYAVSKDVASDINEFSTALFGRDGNIFSKDIVQAYHIFSAIWKKQHTVWNSTAHFNNYMSNVVMHHIRQLNTLYTDIRLV